MIKKFSQEWFTTFCNKINEDGRYKKDSKGWIWDILFIIVGDESSNSIKLGIKVIVRMKLREGRCEGIEITKDENVRNNEYAIKGKASVWEEILQGKMSFINAVLRGDLVVTGNIKRLTEYLQAVNDLVRIATTV